MPFPSAASSTFNLDKMQADLRGQDPPALLVPGWLVQKVMALDRGSHLVFLNPRVPAHLIRRDRLLDLASDANLPVDGELPEAPVLVLVARPDADEILTGLGQQLLLRYWRWIFHARVKAAVRHSLAAEADPRASAQQRIEQVGRRAFNEARFVLLRERYLTAAADDVEAYAEFAATFLELRRLVPGAAQAFFPAIGNAERIEQILARDCEAEAMLASSQPGEMVYDNTATPEEPAPATPAARRRPQHAATGLLDRAARAQRLGNDVRAAIYRMQVCRSGIENRAAIHSDALESLDHLVSRLALALKLDDAVARQWRAWLTRVLDNAAGGWWNAEGRMLYDLQKACVYHEREIYSVDVIDWLLGLGKRPLKRPQPGQRLVLVLKSLRSALGRVARIRCGDHDKQELARLIGHAIETLQRRLREMVCPQIEQSLDAAKIIPGNRVERVARRKLVQEMLDGITERGYMSFGQLRDAVSRNQMKLPDLTEGQRLAGSEQLLRLDAELDRRLDDLYHRAEIYLKLFHLVSALFFATVLGRFVTRWVAMPFGGAFLILEGLDHSVGKLIQHLTHPRAAAVAAAQATAHALAPTPVAAAEPAKAHALFNQWWLVLCLGVLLLGVINFPLIRRGIVRALRLLGRGLRLILIDAPRWLLTRPWFKRLFASRAVRWIGRYVVKPALLALVAWLLVPESASDRAESAIVAAAFVASNLLLNSAIGRVLEQSLLHTLRTTLARFTWEILLAAGRAILHFFGRLLEGVDRLLYAVDELLRFRAGQRRSAIAGKAALGILWFYIAYATRFIINLLVEPQINPIKHFPVVTVSHKMLFPTIPYVAQGLETMGVAKASAVAYGGAIVTAIPGIFGFLAWEFKENWKLYRANRSAALRSVRVGSHGETLAQLLRPGFHSGTIPKIYHKLRKAVMRRSPGAVGRLHHELHHVAEAVEAFVERELLALLRDHPQFTTVTLVKPRADLSATSLRVELGRTSDHVPGESSLVLLFEQRGGWIVAGVEQQGWSSELTPAQKHLLAAAITGLYHLAAVDVVEEQLMAALPAGSHYDLRKRELLVWPGPDFLTEAAYELSATPPLQPVLRRGECALPDLEPQQILFRKSAILRREWVAMWESPQPLSDLQSRGILDQPPQEGDSPAAPAAQGAADSS